MSRYLLLLCPLLFLTSCFTTYQAERPEQGSPSQSHLVLYRKGIAGFAAGARIYDNGHFLGKVGARRYISCWLPSGEHNIEIRYSFSDRTFFKVNMMQNKTYAFSFSCHFVDMWRPKVRKMDDTNVITNKKAPLVNYFE